MKSNAHFFSLIAILFTIAFSNNTSGITLTSDEDIIPKDFDPKKHVLLVYKIMDDDPANIVDERPTKELEEYMQKNYPHPFKMVTMADIGVRVTDDLRMEVSYSGEYADTTIYKYILTCSSETGGYTSPRTNPLGGTRTRSYRKNFSFCISTRDIFSDPAAVIKCAPKKRTLEKGIEAFFDALKTAGKI